MRWQVSTRLSNVGFARHILEEGIRFQAVLVGGIVGCQMHKGVQNGYEALTAAMQPANECLHRDSRSWYQMQIMLLLVSGMLLFQYVQHATRSCDSMI